MKLPPAEFFSKFEQIYIFMRISLDLLKKLAGKNFVSLAVSDILPGDDFILVADENS